MLHGVDIAAVNLFLVVDQAIPKIVNNYLREGSGVSSLHSSIFLSPTVVSIKGGSRSGHIAYLQREELDVGGTGCQNHTQIRNVLLLPQTLASSGIYDYVEFSKNQLVFIRQMCSMFDSQGGI